MNPENVLIPLLEDLIAIGLAAALLHVIFASRRGEARDRQTRALLGLVFAITVFALTLSSFDFEGIGSLDATAGALIFAGYLGGPLSSAIALVIALVLRVFLVGHLDPFDSVTHACYALAGVAMHRLLPFRIWPRLPRWTLALGLGLFLLAQAAAVGVGRLLRIEPGVDDLLRYLMLSSLIGAGSVLMMWVAVRQSCRTAAISRERTDLAHRTHLVLKEHGIGTFVRVGHSMEIVADQALLDLYELEGRPGVWPLSAFVDKMHPDDRVGVLTEATDDGYDGSPTLYRIVRSDGSVRHIRVLRMREQHDLDAEGVRSFGIHTDITDVTEAENKRVEAQRRLALIAEQIPGVVIQARYAEGRMLGVDYIGPKCIDFWGHSAEEILANGDLMHASEREEDLARFLAAVAKGVETGEPIRIRLPLHHVDGTLRWLDFHASAAPLSDGTHRIDGLFLNVSEAVAAQKEAEHQAEVALQAQKSEVIGRLTEGMAHDVNNVLAVVMGNLELLREDVSEEDQLETIDLSLEATQRGANLARSLLAFARRAPLQPRALDLNAVIGASEGWMRGVLPESVSLQTQLDEDLWPTELDRASLESALLNLVLNACDAMEQHGNLTVCTTNVEFERPVQVGFSESTPPGRFVKLSVRDTGSGIEPSELDRIFEPFFTTKPTGQGSGIGLSMVQGFVRQSGGSVRVESEPGRGTTFELFFPAGLEPIEEDPPSGNVSILQSQQGALRILLVEDEHGVRTAMTGILEAAGHRVVGVDTADAALDRFAKDSDFDVLITDIVMPGAVQGMQLAERLRDAYPDLPVVFMSGYSPDVAFGDGAIGPNDTFLTKPVPRKQLLKALAGLRRRRPAEMGTLRPRA